MSRSSTKTIEADNQYSDAVYLHGSFNLSLSGTWNATVCVQRSFDGGATWLDVESFEESGEYAGFEPEDNVMYRFGVPTGAYTSGSVVGRLSTLVHKFGYVFMQPWVRRSAAPV